MRIGPLHNIVAGQTILMSACEAILLAKEDLGIVWELALQAVQPIATRCSVDVDLDCVVQHP